MVRITTPSFSVVPSVSAVRLRFWLTRCMSLIQTAIRLSAFLPRIWCSTRHFGRGRKVSQSQSQDPRTPRRSSPTTTRIRLIWCPRARQIPPLSLLGSIRDFPPFTHRVDHMRHRKHPAARRPTLNDHLPSSAWTFKLPLEIQLPTAPSDTLGFIDPTSPYSFQLGHHGGRVCSFPTANELAAPGASIMLDTSRRPADTTDGAANDAYQITQTLVLEESTCSAGRNVHMSAASAPGIAEGR